MTDATARDAEIRDAAERWFVPYGDLRARMDIEPGSDPETLASDMGYQFIEIAKRSGELAYLLQYEGDIFANAERYRTIRDSIVARAN